MQTILATSEVIMDREEFLKQMLKYSASAGSPEEHITHILDYMGRKLEADRTYIFEKNNAGNSDNTYEWCAEGVKPQKDKLQDIKTEGFLDLWYKEFESQRGIFIIDLEDYKNVSLELYEGLKVQDIHSLITWPIFLNEICIGFLGVDNPLRCHMEDALRIFEMVGYIMTMIFRHRDNVRILKRLSYEDQLTGVKNRRELDVFINNEYPNVLSIGIISCDLNGLKRINDMLGHKEGDRYIISMGHCLAGVFGYNHVYRMGGDEFIAIDINLTEAEFEEKVTKLLKNLAENGIPAAVGYVFRPDNKTKFSILLERADNKMYEDKGRYYSDSRHERRRS